MSPLFELKEKIKAKNKDIRELKDTIKSLMRSGNNAGSVQFRLYFESKPDVRAHHIAYSELRGVERGKIEKPAKDNPPDEKKITEIKLAYGSLLRDWLQKTDCDRALSA